MDEGTVTTRTTGYRWSGNAVRRPDAPASPELTLEDLLAAVAEGDAVAFGDLYGRIVYPVMNMVRMVLRDAPLAEEVTQDVFLAVWLNAGRFDPLRGRAGAWIVGLARSRAIDRIRSLRASRDRDTRYLLGVDERAPSADDLVLARMERVRMHDALAVLTSLQRQAVMLAFFGGHTYPEVADLLGVPLPTVKSRVRDGLHRLRRHLESGNDRGE